jgi:hypothetical protein
MESKTSDALQQPPSFDDMVGLIKKLFTDYLTDIQKNAFTAEEIEKAWERYKILNHLYQDESPSTEGNKEREIDGLRLLRWISDMEWGSAGGGEFINHKSGRIIKEQTLLKEFNEWDSQQNKKQ